MRGNGTNGIYILTNASFPNFLKIGYASDVEAMVDDLNSSEVTPFPYRLLALYETNLETAGDKAGKVLQRSIERLAQKDNSTDDPIIQSARERGFYTMTPDEAFQLLEDLAVCNGCFDKLRRFDVAREEGAEIKVLERLAHPERKRRYQFCFSMIGLKPGDEIQYRYDPAISCRIIAEKAVEYKGKRYSLSALATVLSGKQTGIQGPVFFTYNGEVLNDIRIRMEEEEKKRYDPKGK